MTESSPSSLFQRQAQIKQLSDNFFDVIIVGGGINGAVSAAALAARGCSVALVERRDFAGETSSQSSNLVWGGIKYLETHEYGLVNNLCQSRNQLMEAYPSTVQEIRFLTTIQKGFRFPPFFIYLGSVLYWILGRFKTRAPKLLSAKGIKARSNAIDVSNSIGGLEYSDCFLYDNDSRFVFNFVRRAQKSGAVTLNYLEAKESSYEDDQWQLKLHDNLTNESLRANCKVLINACGPWVDTQNQLNAISTEHSHLFSKGVHLTVPKLSDNDRILAFFASDGRLFFVIPMGPVTCLGTTDSQVPTPETEVTDEDRDFILSNVNALLDLERPLTKEDIIAERCGVRPLAAKGTDSEADWVALSRKHAVDIDAQQKHISIFGGKTTDCINVGDEITDIVEDLGVQMKAPISKWYGEPSAEERQNFFQRAKSIGLDQLTHPSSPEPLSTRLWRRYANDALPMLDAIEKNPKQAELVIENAEYIRCELTHAAEHEMICKLDDFLRRRSKIAMVVNRKVVAKSDGLVEACKTFFGDSWREHYEGYLEQA